MQLTGSAFTPKRQQINTIQKLIPALPEEADSWAKEREQMSKRKKKSGLCVLLGLVCQEFLEQGQIAEGWRQKQHALRVTCFRTKTRERRSRPDTTGEVGLRALSGSWGSVPSLGMACPLQPAKAGDIFWQESANRPGRWLDSWWALLPPALMNGTSADFGEILQR